MRRFLLFLLFISGFHSVQAGYYDKLSDISDAEERNAIVRKMYFTHEIPYHEQAIQTAAAELERISKQVQDDRLQAFALVMMANFDLWCDMGEESFLQNSLNKIGDIARKENDLFLQVDYLHLQGKMRYRLKNYEQAFEYLLKANDIIKKHGYCQFPYASVYLYDLGLYYYRFLDYTKAVELILQATECNPPAKIDLLNNYNTIGLAKRQLGDYPTSLAYFQKAQQIATALHDSAWYGITSGNMGFVYYKMGDIDKALPLLLMDYKLSMKHKQWSSAINSNQMIATIYLAKNNLEQANQRIHLLDTIYKNVSDPLVNYQFYETKATIEKAYGRFKEAYTFLDSSHYFQQLHLRQNNPLITKKAEQKTQIESHLANLQLLESEKKQQLIVRNAIIIAIFLLLIIAAQWIYRQKQKHKQQQEDIKNSRYQLKSYIENIREKNLLIEAFQKEIAQLQAESEYNTITETAEIKLKLQKFTILTEEDWQEFKHLFEQVYQHFFQDLNRQYPGLTQSEMRLIALNKLNLSKKEMSEMLGVSLDAIRKTRQRIRYKLNIPDEKSLEEWLQSI